MVSPQDIDKKYWRKDNFFFFLLMTFHKVYIYILSKFFADDTALFWVIYDIIASFARLTNDIVKIQDRFYNWKRSFNPNKNMQTQEVIFSLRL